MMSTLSKELLKKQYPIVKEKTISGRWIRIENILPLYRNLPYFVVLNKLGTSEEERPIYQLKFGKGKKRVLIWSQMHGNESTGTKAVFDFLNFFKLFYNEGVVQKIIKNCSIEIIPMLNPDGAENYTRVNANKIDLNRDAIGRKAKESNLLRSALNSFNPQFCFNLHDQRTIFGVKGTTNPATISFLAPSEEKNRKITNGRKQTMNVIVAMNKLLQQIIPNHIGRYTDEFYPTATGDVFQKLGHNTILIEAGHFPDDYEREKVRKFNFFALLQGVYHIAISNSFLEYKPYFDIPNNQKNFYDIIHRADNEDKAFQYEEKIINNKFTLIKKEISTTGKLHNFLGHKEN